MGRSATADDEFSQFKEASPERRLSGPAVGLHEHTLNLYEPGSCRLRIRVAGRFVRADVPVIGCIRFRTGTSWRTMEREASTKGTAAPGSAGAETCGGVMVRGPKSGNGTRSPVYYLDPAELAPPRALRGEMDPLAVGPAGDGWAAAEPAACGSWRGAGGRWLLWPLRVVLCAALLGGA